MEDVALFFITRTTCITLKIAHPFYPCHPSVSPRSIHLRKIIILMEIFAPIEKSLDGIHFFQENFWVCVQSVPSNKVLLPVFLISVFIVGISSISKYRKKKKKGKRIGKEESFNRFKNHRNFHIFNRVSRQTCFSSKQRFHKLNN